MRGLYRNSGGPHRMATVRPILRGGEWVGDVSVRPGEVVDMLVGCRDLTSFPEKWQPVEPAEGQESPLELEQYHLNGSWYLIGGKKYNGKGNARAALNALKEDPDGSEDHSSSSAADPGD